MKARLLTRDDPPKFHAVISEDALKALAKDKDTEVTAEQLAHLVEMAGPDQPNTTVQVIRLVHAVPAVRRGVNQWGVSDFTLVEFADPADPGGFYGPDNLFRDGPDFSELLDHFGRISRSALSPDESVLFLKNRLEALNRSTGSPSTGQGRRSAPGLPTSHASGHPLGAPTPRTRQGPRDGRRRGPSA
ncbi:MAG: Scr1 family TA system antitoxin-like transcriptional regulator [Mycobacteriales bacterium]